MKSPLLFFILIIFFGFFSLLMSQRAKSYQSGQVLVSAEILESISFFNLGNKHIISTNYPSGIKIIFSRNYLEFDRAGQFEYEICENQSNPIIVANF